jgi:hypothetical protein
MLDNVIWYALNSQHRSFRHGTALAVRYAAHVSRFAALARPTPGAFSDLGTLVQPGESVALLTAEPLDVPPEWQVVRSRPLEQMVCDRLEGDAPRLNCD